MSRRPSGRQVENLRFAMQQLFRRFGALAADATPCGKPLSMAHAHALMVLSERGELSQQELGTQLGIDKSNVARLCAKLVELGQAVQCTSSEDGRSRRVVLTTRGERLASEVERASRARFEALLDAVPPTERAGVVDALNQLLCAIDQLSASGATRTGSESASRHEKEPVNHARP